MCSTITPRPLPPPYPYRDRTGDALRSPTTGRTYRLLSRLSSSPMAALYDAGHGRELTVLEKPGQVGA